VIGERRPAADGPGYGRPMYPTLLEVQTAAGVMPVHTYGLFIVLAFSAAFLAIHLRAPLVGIQADRLIPGYVAAAVGGLSGGRLLYAVAVEPARTFSNPMSLFSCSGFAVYGGILGGIVGVAIFTFAARLPPWKIADLAAPAVVLAMGVGRWACFFAGCCHGAVAPIGPDPTGLLPSSFTGGQVWVSSVAPFLTNEVHGGVTGREYLYHALYPTQLWDMALHVTLGALLLWRWYRSRFDGEAAALALMLEPPLRVFTELFRADHRGYVFTFPVSEEVAAWLPPGLSAAGAEAHADLAGVTTSQGIALLMMVAGLGMWFARHRKGRDQTPVAPQPAAGDLLDELTA
jgi:phosphatidylglycerol:prolipoprotein diacylglycerol transferase